MSGAVKVLKTAAKAVDKVSGPLSALKKMSKASDTLSLLKNMDFNKIAKTFGSATSLTKTTSSIADTASTLKSFSKAIPASTDNILGSLSSSIKNVDINSLSSLNKLASPDLLKSAANVNTLSRLKKVSLAVTSVTSPTGNLARRSTKVISKGSNFKAIAKSIPPVNKLDDVAGALKKGKGVIGKLDEVGDVGKSVAKNADEAADGAKTLKKGKQAVSFVSKHGGKIQAAIILYYFYGEAKNLLKMRRENKEGEEVIGCDADCPLELITDPGSEIYDVALFGPEVVVTEGGGLTLTETLFTKEILIGAAVVSIMMVALSY